MRVDRKILSIVLMILVCLGACSSPEDPALSGEESERSLPSRSGSLLCDGEAAPVELTVCTWVDSVDGLVYGEVVQAEFVDSPSYSEGTMAEVESCGTFVSPALEVELRLTEVFTGEFQIDETIKFRVGAEILADWEPGFEVDLDTLAFYWEDENGALLAGDELGVAVYLYDETGHWTTDAEPLFRVNGGKVVFQDGESCGDWVPEELVDLAWSDFKTEIGACDGDLEAGEERRNTISAGWVELYAPTRTVGAICFDEEDSRELEQGSCLLDRHCEEGELCVNDLCLSAECKENGHCVGDAICVDHHCEDANGD